MTINLARTLACAFAALTLLSQFAMGAETDSGNNKLSTAQKEKQESDLHALTQLAEDGDVETQYLLGLLFYAGNLGAPKDYKEAVKWYTKAAEQGYALAQYNLGVMYREGQGVIQDYKEAVKWYRKAAEQGYAPAQYSLGWMYAKGEGITQDYKEAVKWYRKAAEQGYADAQFTLGSMYDFGKGVIQDYVQAHAWYNVASANSNESGSKNRDSIAKLMTPEQIAKAQELAKEYFEKYQPKK